MNVRFLHHNHDLAVQFPSASPVSAFPTIKMKHWKTQSKKFDRRRLDATKGQ